jgi:hypothetical protein
MAKLTFGVDEPPPTAAPPATQPVYVTARAHIMFTNQPSLWWKLLLGGAVAIAVFAVVWFI